MKVLAVVALALVLVFLILSLVAGYQWARESVWTHRANKADKLRQRGVEALREALDINGIVHYLTDEEIEAVRQRLTKYERIAHETSEE